MWIVIFLGGALLSPAMRCTARQSENRAVDFSVVTADIRFGQSGKICFLPHTAGGEYKLKCPNCGAADYCANLDKRRKNKKKEGGLQGC